MVIQLKFTDADATPLWALRSRLGGRGARRVQRGGLLSEAAARGGLADAVASERRRRALARITFADLVSDYLVQFSAEGTWVRRQVPALHRVRSRGIGHLAVAGDPWDRHHRAVTTETREHASSVGVYAHFVLDMLVLRTQRLRDGVILCTVSDFDAPFTEDYGPGDATALCRSDVRTERVPGQDRRAVDRCCAVGSHATRRRCR